MLATAHAGCLIGIDAHPVQVEVQVGTGLPGFDIVGLPERGVRESRVRVKSALQAFGFKLPPRQLVLNLAPGDTVLVSGNGLQGGSLTARVVSSDARVATDSRSLGYRALLADPPPALKAGSVVDVEVVTGVKSGVFRLPASAVRKTNFGASVYVLNDAEAGASAPYRAARKEVTVGGVDGSDILVIGGLEAGERVAAIGAFKLQDGLLVHVVDQPPEPEQ